MNVEQEDRDRLAREMGDLADHEHSPHEGARIMVSVATRLLAIGPDDWERPLVASALRGLTEGDLIFPRLDLSLALTPPSARSPRSPPPSTPFETDLNACQRYLHAALGRWLV